MRTVSDTFRHAMFDQQTDELPVLLLTISHPDLGSVWRLSSDNADLLDAEEQLRGTISRGQNYYFFPMDVSLPEDGEDASNVIQITLDNVTREITPLLKSTVTPASVTIEIVLASAPDEVEIEFPDFELASADVDAGSVVLSLTVDTMASEPFPADNFTPSSFGGLWAST
ncbi:hypothetical protein HNR59_001215 [Aquamicrobium lusatiense]|uniref:Uncharacterized protein n=1 Tax=Aquamicrobium lusatiense TaxID=89772 RepID=A0A7W9S0Y4_9HYPH|nr:DUF1833 family protein [Aquamicrobium lusatiense]MBB6011870.1 hypothetical protein [Aquamicrobium lusatiense]